MELRSFISESEEKPLYQLLFLKNDEDQNVEVEEVERIDFRKIKKRLIQGDSVFITPKTKQKLKAGHISKKNAAEPLYFAHV